MNPRMLTLILTLCSLSSLSYGAEKAITLETKKIDGAVHWVPEKIEVCPGDKLTITAKHELEGGFDFHGLFIPALKVSKQVDRNKRDFKKRNGKNGNS